MTREDLDMRLNRIKNSVRKLAANVKSKKSQRSKRVTHAKNEADEAEIELKLAKKELSDVRRRLSDAKHSLEKERCRFRDLCKLRVKMDEVKALEAEIAKLQEKSSTVAKTSAKIDEQVAAIIEDFPELAGVAKAIKDGKGKEVS